MHDTIAKGKKRIVGAARHISAGLKPRAALTNQNRAGIHPLAAVGFNTQHLRVGIAAIRCAPLTFCMRHDLLRLNTLHAQTNHILSVALFALIIFSTFKFKRYHLWQLHGAKNFASD